jgi:hypothetical protein
LSRKVAVQDISWEEFYYIVHPKKADRRQKKSLPGEKFPVDPHFSVELVYHLLQTIFCSVEEEGTFA